MDLRKRKSFGTPEALLLREKELDFLLKEGEGYNLEFKESDSSDLAKEICAFANATGGKILIGVTDRGEVKGISISNRLKSQIVDIARNMDPKLVVSLEKVGNVLIVNVPEGKNKPYSVNGKFFMRYGPNSQQLGRDEIRELFYKEGLILWEEKQNREFNFPDDFNKDAFDTFLRLSRISPVSDEKELLQNLALLRDGKIKNAGVLLFCKNIINFCPMATIMCVLFRGKDKVKILDSKEFAEDLYHNYQNAFQFVSSKLNTEYIIKGGPREEVLELPEDALREALLNAIAHRNYFTTAHIQINIFADRVEVVNPGGLVPGMKYSDLGKRSMPRNSLLFGLLQRMDLIEKAGTGILRMKKAMERYLLPEPKIEADENWFTITFQRPDLQKMTIQERLEGPRKKVLDRVLEKVTENQKKILQQMAQNPRISSRELGEFIGISDRKVRENVRKLKDKGVIRRVGSAKGGHWVVIG